MKMMIVRSILSASYPEPCQDDNDNDHDDDNDVDDHGDYDDDHLQ